MDFPWKWYLRDLPPPMRGKAFSTFACGGGSSMGYKRAGYEVVGCVEIDPAINRVYCANLHPRHNFLMDLRAFNALETLPDELYHLDILDGSPPCFAAGTLVKVRGGHRPIEEVAVGDEVLTRMGRYRRVTATMARTAEETLAVKVQGSPEIVTTPNHPFYAMTPNRKGKDEKRRPRWIEAGRLDRSTYVALAIEGMRMRAWTPVLGTAPKGAASVYNLSVEEDETYTVTAANVIVHNCSTFSMAGKREAGWGVEKQFREGQAKQTLDDLFFVYLKTVERLKPKVCVAENVTGLVKGNAKGYVNEIAARFRELGYSVQLFLLNAAFMEIPQRRERVFFVANRCGFPKLRLKFNYRPVKFGEIKSPRGDEITSENVGDVDSLFRLLAKARIGDSNLSDINGRERGKPNTGFSRKFLWDGEVPNTAVSGDSLIRMPERRWATKEDIVAMGTFPQDYVFNLDGDERKAKRMATYMVGMSVPPSMTAHIADEIWNQWLSKDAESGR